MSGLSKENGKTLLQAMNEDMNEYRNVTVMWETVLKLQRSLLTIYGKVCNLLSNDPAYINMLFCICTGWRGPVTQRGSHRSSQEDSWLHTE